MLKGIIGCVLCVVGIIFVVFFWTLKDSNSIHREYKAIDKFKYAACIGAAVAGAVVVLLGVVFAYTGWCDFFMSIGGGTRVIG